MEFSIMNCRELGGICNKKGQQIKAKKLIRSSQLINLNQEDRQLLTETYHLRQIVDLRTEREILQAPDPILPGASYVRLDLLDQIEAKWTRFAEFLRLTSPAAVEDYYLTSYQQMILHPVAQSKWRKFFTLAAETEEGAFLFHCFAGKDRTGLAAALLLALLEVEQETIFEDYEQSNQERYFVDQELLLVLEKQGVSPARLAVVEAILTVKRAYLAGAFQVIQERYGTMQGYAEAIGIKRAQLIRLRQIYLTEN